MSSILQIKNFEFLKTQLDLTFYETLALVAIIYGNRDASSIHDHVFADMTIPRPKVYGAIEALEKKGLIVRNKDNNLEPNPSQIAIVREDASKQTKSYIRFIEELYSLSMSLAIEMYDVQKEIEQLLRSMNYRIEESKEITRLFPEEKLRSYLDNSVRFERRYRSIRHYPPNPQIRLPQLVAESPNSGIRTGFFFDPKIEESPFKSEMYLPALDMIGCSAGMILTNQQVDTYYLKSDPRVTLYCIPTVSDYKKRTQKHLTDLDLMHSDLKKRLTSLEFTRDKTKERIRSLMYRVSISSKHEKVTSNNYRLIYEDILERIKKDLDNYDQYLSELDERVHKYFNMLSAMKVLFPSERVSMIEQRMETLNEKLDQKEQHILDIEEELYSIPEKGNIYSQFGLKLNPFSLTVPICNPSKLINQNNARTVINQFIDDIVRGSDSNFALIVGKQGVGKTHILNYFANKINNNDFGKSIAVTIRCKSNRDLIDLYPQIVDGLKSTLVSKGDVKLDLEISGILTNLGTPRLIQDMMKILNEVALALMASHYKGLFILVDEFENSLPTVHEETHFGDRFHRRGIPASISQLDLLAKVAGIGFIITFREEDWERWHEDILNGVSKYEKSYFITITGLSFEDSKLLLEERLRDEEFKSKTIKARKIEFSDALVKKIREKSDGIPRDMLRLSSRVLRIAARKRNIKILDESLLKNIPGSAPQ